MEMALKAVNVANYHGRVTGRSAESRDSSFAVLRPSFGNSSGVCRCLFGRADREENLKELRRCRAKLEEQSAERWNFDFRFCRPLIGGRYEWSKADAADAAAPSSDNLNCNPSMDKLNCSSETNATQTRNAFTANEDGENVGSFDASDILSARRTTSKGRLSNDVNVTSNDKHTRNSASISFDSDVRLSTNASTEVHATRDIPGEFLPRDDAINSVIASNDFRTSEVAKLGVSATAAPRSTRVLRRKQQQSLRRKRELLFKANHRPMTEYFPVTKKVCYQKRESSRL